jgi:hypothetical protein
LLDYARDDVRLLEVRRVGIEDEWVASEVVPKKRCMSLVPTLRHAGCIPRSDRLGGIKMNREVLRVQDSEIESVVLNLVAAEVLSAGTPSYEWQRKRNA